jgi:aspartate kinase
VRIVVQKYGGSSVSDVDKLRQVAERVAATHRDGYAVVVAVSAMGNTTSELLELARKVSPAPHRRELDMLVSVGERIAMALLAMAINDLGVPAASFTGSQSGIITDESHAAARVVAVRPHRVRAALEAGKVAIVAGYQGVSRDKEVTTLGRGGTDTTAIALAGALGAQWCEICSDVDGVYSADPRVVADAVRLERMSLDEILALARGGARVLAADAVAYAHANGIELVLSQTDGRAAGTRIQVAPLPPRVSAIAADDQLEWFALESPAAAGPLLEALSAARAPLRAADPGGALVSLRDWPDRAAFSPPAGARSAGRVAALSAACAGLGGDAGLAARGLAALAGAGVPVTGFTAAPDLLTWRVAPLHAAAGQRALHAALIQH